MEHGLLDRTWVDLPISSGWVLGFPEAMAIEADIPAKVRTDGADRLLSAPFLRLALADLAYFTAAGVAIFALPLYVTGPLGSDEAAAGLAFGAFAVSALVFRPIAGRLSDRYGRRPLLVGGAALCALAMLLTAAVSSLALLIVLRVVLGVAEAAFFVASFAALADLAPASRLGEALSYNSLGLYLGLAAGPPAVRTWFGFGHHERLPRSRHRRGTDPAGFHRRSGRARLGVWCGGRNRLRRQPLDTRAEPAVPGSKDTSTEGSSEPTL